MNADEILKQMNEAGFTPEAVEDSSGFKPLTGEYIAVIQAVKRQTGTSAKGNEYDFISINAQIDETVGGDKGDNRFIDGLTFPLNQDFGLPSFCNAAFTAGVELDKSNMESLMESAQQLVGKTINVRTWVKNDFANAKIVKEFKAKKAKAETAESSF